MLGAELHLFVQSLFVIFYIYSFINIIASSLGAIIIWCILACALYSALLIFSIKRAHPSSVEKVFGPPWGAYKHGSELDLNDSLKVIAHRACGMDAPENSLSALKFVTKRGIKAVEFDVMLTCDNVPVVFHDSSLMRMAGVSKMMDTIPCKDLQNIDISMKSCFGEDFAGEKIPTFKSFIDYCLENEVAMFIDLKDFNLVGPVLEAFERNPRLVDFALVSSFDPLLIYKIRSVNPSIMGCLAWRPYYHSHEEFFGKNGPNKPRSSNFFVHWWYLLMNIVHGWLLWNVLYHFLGLSALLLHKDMISRDVIDHWKNRGVRILAWTVNDPSEKRYFEHNFQIPYLTDTILEQ